MKKDKKEVVTQADINDILDDVMGINDPTRPLIKDWAIEHLVKYADVILEPGATDTIHLMTVGEMTHDITLTWEGYQLKFALLHPKALPESEMIERIKARQTDRASHISTASPLNTDAHKDIQYLLTRRGVMKEALEFIANPSTPYSRDRLEYLHLVIAECRDRASTALEE